MIKIEFINSKDKDIIGIYLTYKQVLSLVYSYKNDIIIRDKLLSKDTYTLSLSENGLHISNNQKDSFYHINGKKYSGKKKTKIGDEVKIQSTNFFIKEIKYEKRKSYLDIINNNNELTENPELEELFTLLKKEIYHLEREINAKK